MSVSIRKIGESDITAVLELMREFAAFENLTDQLTITEELLREAMFDDMGFVEGFVAEDVKAIVGFALFYPCFSSFRGQRGLYLEDIYIKPEYRGHGVGKTMLREIARIAASRGFERIDFQVLDWNTNAVAFYESLSAVSDNDTRHFKFTDDAFKDLAS